MNRSRSDYAKLNIISGMVFRAIAIIFSFVIRYAITHSMGMEYLGVTSYITSVLNLINITELGIGTAITFALYKPLAENNEDQICAILKLYRKLYRFCGVIFLIIGILLMPFIRKFISGDIPAALNIYIVYFLSLINATIPYLCFEYRKVLFDASQHSYIPNFYYTLNSIVLNVVQIIAIVAFHDFYLYTGLTIVSSIVNSICALTLTKKKYPRIACKGIVDPEIVEKLKTQVSGLFITKIVTLSRSTLDNLIITNLSGLISTAIYGSYFQIVNSLTLVTTIITGGLTSSVGNSIVTETKEKNLMDLKKLHFMFCGLVSWATTCMYFLYQPFIQGFYGSTMLTDEWTKNIFCIYYFLISTTLARDLYMDACGLWNERKMPAIFEAVVKMLLSFVLGQYFGIAGMLCGTIISFVFFNLVWITYRLKQVFFKDVSNLRFIYLQIVKYGLITLITLLIINGIASVLGITSFIGLTILCVIVPPLIFSLFSFNDPLLHETVAWLKMIMHL